MYSRALSRIHARVLSKSTLTVTYPLLMTRRNGIRHSCIGILRVRMSSHLEDRCCQLAISRLIRRASREEFSRQWWIMSAVCAAAWSIFTTVGHGSQRAAGTSVIELDVRQTDIMTDWLDSTLCLCRLHAAQRRNNEVCDEATAAAEATAARNLTVTYKRASMEQSAHGFFAWGLNTRRIIAAMYKILILKLTLLMCHLLPWKFRWTVLTFGFGTRTIIFVLFRGFTWASLNRV